MTTLPISAVVMTRDEAPNVRVCLAPLVGTFADVFVVDSESADGTPELAAAAGATVVPFRWDGRYPKKKQWCLERLAFGGRWVLFVDADEVVTRGVLDELRALFADGPDAVAARAAAFWVSARPVVRDRPLRFGHRNRKLALLDRTRCRFVPADDLDVERMWEVEGHYQPRVDGPMGRLRAPVLHWDRKPLFSWFERHNRYSDWEARLSADGRLAGLAAGEPARRRALKAVFRSLPARPAAVFLLDYVVRMGALDGLRGLDFAVARAVYYWQIDVKRRALVAGARP